MFKKSLAVAMAVMMTVSLAGCAAGEKIADATGKRSDYDKCKSSYYGTVKLADYDEFEIYSDEVSISDDDVDSEINSVLESDKSYEDTDETDVTDKSIVDISYVGTIKVKKKDFAFDGGTADNQTLDIANSSYIEGFAEGLVGHKVGEKVELNLTFPENYTNSTKDADGKELKLAGKKVKFEVTVNKIVKEVTPELTDDYVKKNLKDKYGVETADGLKEYFKNQLEISKVGSTNALADYVEKCDVKVDEDGVKKEVDKQLSSFKDTLEQQSMTMDDYLTQYGNGESEADLKKKIKESITNQFKTYAVICAVVEKSGTVLKEERYNKWLKQIAAQSKYEKVDDFINAYEQYYKSYYGQEIDAEDTFTIQCTYLDAMEILIDKGNVKEGTRPEETTTEEATTAAEDASVEETTEAEETTAD